VGAALQFGGRALSTMLSMAADASSSSAGRNSYEANKAARLANYARREQDWAYQSNLAAGEMSQIFKQLRAAQIREAIAAQELASHRLQMKHAAEIERFLNEEGTAKTGKKTNKALYTWMKREVKGLYAESFQLAFDIARKAERALQHELGNPDLSYLQFGYLGGKEGLLAGEKLYQDVKRMEMAFHELNQREYELTKHVSLLQLDPLALIELRATGSCTVRLPEELFDLDSPGHYFRRIKSLAVSIPCVVGPYTSVNCTLTLLKSSIRKSPVVGQDYARSDDDTDRFDDYYGSLQSIVAGSAQADSGLFETNLHDERYLPFENSGVISEWQIRLPADPSQGDPMVFDYNTIADVILHIRYTAREGGALLRNAAVSHLRALFPVSQAPGCVRLFSVRHEFPAEWAAFVNQTPAAGHRFTLTLTPRAEHYPFWSQGQLNSVSRVDIVACSTAKPVPATLAIFKSDDATNGATMGSLDKDGSLGGLLVGRLDDTLMPIKPYGDPWTYRFYTNAVSDLWIAATWGATTI